MEMSDSELKNEMRCAIKFCYRLGKTAPETVKLMKEAYKDKCFGESTIFRWHGDFKKGRLSAELAPRPGRPKSVVNDRNVNTVWVILQENRRMTCEEIAASTNISKTSIFRILRNNLQLRYVCSRWVPHHLTKEQMKTRIHQCCEWKQMLQNDPNLLKTVITGDETWVHHYDPLTKSATSVWKHTDSPPPKKIRQTKSAGKVMMIIFFDHKGVIYQHAVPPKTTVNGEYYVSVLKILRQHISRKRHELVGNWTLHHDNARPHVATSVQQYLSKCNIKIMPHPPYSPDLAPCDFWLFPTLKEKLRGRKFNTDSEVISAVEGSLKQLPEKGFSTCFEKWVERWDRCISSDGRYFEKE